MTLTRSLTYERPSKHVVLHGVFSVCHNTPSMKCFQSVCPLRGVKRVASTPLVHDTMRYWHDLEKLPYNAYTHRAAQEIRQEIENPQAERDSRLCKYRKEKKSLRRDSRL